VPVEREEWAALALDGERLLDQLSVDRCTDFDEQAPRRSLEERASRPTAR
jgi:hypothetical protein